MKKINFLLTGILCFTLFFSCSKEDASNTSEAKVSLSFGPILEDLVNKNPSVKQALEDLPDCSEEAPGYVTVALSSDGNTVVGTDRNPFRIDLVEGQLFTREVPEMQLEPGVYSLDYFAVYSVGGKLLWLAPRAGSMIDFVDHPLPLEIHLGAGTKKYVDVSVMCFDNRKVNEYGYIFFEIEGTKVIEFCIFGNYCNEAGKHFPAEFSVRVWIWNDGEQGSLLYTKKNSVALASNDEFAGTTLCVVLPDSQSADEYYFEITLEDSDAYGNITESVIRSGVINDQQVRDLFTDNGEMEYFHFREGNCNREDAPELFEVGRNGI